jgi:hypothetical protein
VLRLRRYLLLLITNPSRSLSKPVDSVILGRRRYPLMLDTLSEVMKVFSIPLPFVNMLAAHTTIAMDFDTVQDFQSLLTTDFKRTGIICVLGPIALATSFNAATKMTTGIVLGLCNYQATRLISLVRSVAEVSQITMLLPTLLINILSETRAHRVLGRKQAINRTEVDLGVHWSVQADFHPQDVSLEVATRQLTVYGSEVAWDVHAIEAQLEMVALIERVQKSINAQHTAIDNQSPAMVAFLARTRHIRQVLSGLRHWTRYNQQRVQIQLHTVSYSRHQLLYREADYHPDIQFHVTAR